jgi:substrate-binding family protein
MACTAQPGPRPEAAPHTPSPSPAVSVTLPVVVSGGSRTYLEGMRLAADEVGVLLDMRDGADDPVAAVRSAVAQGSPAVLVVGSGAAVVSARPEIEEARVPVVLLGGDLYSDSALFRYAFQTSVPLRWQARVLARYLVVDRGYERIAVTGEEAIGTEALARERVSPTDADADPEAVLALGGRGVPEGPQAALAARALVRRDVPSGSVACSPYTWAGWADMLPRVHRFRERFERHFGRPPSGFEQEGYDAVRALADALSRTGGQGGDELVRALESFREETYSSIPIRLGPDDHVLAEESQLGLFAVAAPDEVPASGEAIGAVPWRPLMRTFTTDGQKVNLLDRDKKVFFPGWGHRKPSPRYWKSMYGIVTRPDEDPLH